MSLSRIIIIVAIVGFVLLVLLIVYSLSPTKRDVSDNPSLRKFLNKPLKIKRPAYIRDNGNGQGFFYYTRNVLSELPEGLGTEVLRLPAGATILIRQFKTYRNNMSTGSTCLLALGEIPNLKSSNIAFEYFMGNVENDFSGSDLTDIPYCIWQDSSHQKIEFLGN